MLFQLSDLQINISKFFCESHFFISSENGNKRQIFALLTDFLSHSHDYQRPLIYLKFSKVLSSSHKLYKIALSKILLYVINFIGKIKISNRINSIFCQVEPHSNILGILLLFCKCVRSMLRSNPTLSSIKFGPYVQ